MAAHTPPYPTILGGHLLFKSNKPQQQRLDATMGKSTKNRTPASHRWYWVASGRERGVFQGWSRVAALVSGYPGAQYAWCPNQPEATRAFHQATQNANQEQPSDPGAGSHPPDPELPGGGPKQPPTPPTSLREQRLAQLREKYQQKTDAAIPKIKKRKTK